MRNVLEGLEAQRHPTKKHHRQTNGSTSRKSAHSMVCHCGNVHSAALAERGVRSAHFSVRCEWQSPVSAAIGHSVSGRKACTVGPAPRCSKALSGGPSAWIGPSVEGIVEVAAAAAGVEHVAWIVQHVKVGCRVIGLLVL